MKDLFVYYTDPDYCRYLDQIKDIKHVCHYPLDQYRNVSREEWCKYEVDGIRIRFLLDSGHDKHCPWCGNEENEVTCIGENVAKTHLGYCVQCKRCFGRGPVLSVVKSCDEEMLKYYKQYVLERYCQRIKKNGKSILPNI